MVCFQLKVAAVVLAVLAAAGVLCFVDLRCSGGFGADSQAERIKGELAAGRKAMRQQEAESLTQVARDLRILARRYRENGENMKAQRAIGAAQELDKRIAQLLNAE